MSLSKHVSAALRASKKPLATRAFHSPFALLGTSPLTHPNPPSQEVTVSHYEKYYEHAHEPTVTSSGYRTYVVSEPDQSSRHYQVPAGAYPTSAPYENFHATTAPKTENIQLSSTSADILAHGFTTRAAPQNRSGVGHSSAVRHASAPGEMSVLGGSYGGASMMDKEGTIAGIGSLAARNPPPDGNVAEKFSRAGLDGAWKLRK